MLRLFRALVMAGTLAHAVVTSAAPPVNVTTLHEFSATSGPALPLYGSLLDNGAGLFFGMTQSGGDFGSGTVFQFTAGAVTTKVNFTGSGDEPHGSAPVASLIRASDGYYYGTTREGGDGGLGTVFRMDPNGVVMTLVNFVNDGNPATGANPEGSLVAGTSGLYGMTRSGGAAEMGTIFHITFDGFITNIVEFNNNTVTGAFPHGSLVMGSDGNFYGMTGGGGNNGNGTIFKVTPGGTLTTLVRFGGATGPKGSHPYGSLLPAGGNIFYGMTADGGKGFGTIFQVTSGGALTTLVEFADDAAPLGAHPFGNLIAGTDGLLYGLTSAGGIAGKGTVFRINSTGALTTMAEFDDLSILGSAPSGSLMQASDGFYYGLTTTGGAEDAGTLFKLDASLPPPTPEIGVEQPIGVNLTDGVSTVAFGPVAVDNTSELTFIITNSGTGSLLDLTITIDGSNSNLFKVTTLPTPPVAAGGSTIFSVQFTPTNGGPKTATLHIANNDSNESPFDIALTGSGLEPGAALAFDGSNDSVALGSLPELAFEYNNPFTIELWLKTTSTGTQELVSKLNPSGIFRGYEVYMDSGRVYALLNNSYGINMILVSTVSALSPGQWHHVAVAYNGSAAAAGVKIFVDGVAQTLQVSSDTLSATINGNVPAYLGARAGNQFNFNGSMDEVRIWNRALDQCEIQAQRNTELTGDEPGLLDYFQFNEGSAAVNNAGVTTLPNVVPGGATGTLNNFALTGATGNWIAPGGVVTGSTITPYVAPEIDVLGGTPLVSIAKGDTTPGTADGTDFGPLAAGATPLLRTFRITNSGTSQLVVSAISKSGPNVGEFTIGSPGLPALLDPGVATNFTVSFAPTASGLRTATITIISTDCDEASYDFAVSGSGLAPEISVHQPFGTEILDGGTRSVGSVRVGEVTNLTFTITNSGTANLTGLGISIDGTDAAMFSVTTPPTAPVAASNVTTFIVQFAPTTTTGAKTAFLHIASNDGDENPYDILLSATALPPVPEIAILGLNNEIAKGDTTPIVGDDTDFATATVTGAGGTVVHTFTISNSGTAALNVSAINITGANSSDFGVSGIAPPTAVPAKSSVTFNITFDPSAIGTRTAIITVVNNDSDEGNYDFAVQGAGVLAITPLYNFPSGGTEPARPRYSQLVQGTDGMLFGVTELGGDNGMGTVFKITTNGVVTRLASFTGTTGAAKGQNPYGGLTFGLDGLLYGTTYSGGANNKGTLFKITTNGTLTTLVEFTGIGGANNGASPYGKLVRATDGTFYGMASEGGTVNRGTAFKVTTNGALTTLVNFSINGPSNKGSYPYGPLVFGLDGLLYGMTSEGGALGCGTVFKMTTNGTLTTLQEFSGSTGANKGLFPYGGLLAASDGALYGTTAGDGSYFGTLFKITTNGVLTQLVEFTGINGSSYRGQGPYGGLVQGSNGLLYGLTAQGGYYGAGTLFQITTSGTMTTLLDFSDYNPNINQGTSPTGTLLVGLDSLLYGQVDVGGFGGPREGVVFKLDASSASPLLSIPSLSVILSSGNAIVRWPVTGSSGFALEQTTTVAATNSWSAVGGGSLSNDGVTNTATIPVTGFKFFRLKKP